jgi:hypothetical protein
MYSGSHSSNGAPIEPSTVRVTHFQQDFCITSDGTQTIAAGVSELGSKTTIQIWVSRPVPVLKPQVSAPKLVDQQPQPIEPIEVTSSQSCRDESR